MDPWWTIAAGLTLLTAGVHTFAGEVWIARPLLAASDLRRVPKLTAFYCWHMVTILLFAMAAGFARAASVAEAHELGVACTALAGAFAVWNIALVAGSRISPVLMPQWALFLPILVFGALGGR